MNSYKFINIDNKINLIFYNVSFAVIGFSIKLFREAKNRFPRIPKLSKLLKKMLAKKEIDRPDFIELE